MTRNLVSFGDYEKVQHDAENGDVEAQALVNQPGFWRNRAAAAELERTPYHPDSAGMDHPKKTPCSKCDRDDRKPGLGRQPVRFNPCGRH